MSSQFGVIRPPAVPLAVRSPYLSTWLAGDRLAGTWATLWAGQITALTGIVRVDGAAYLFAGAVGSPELPVLQQVSISVTATRSIFVFDGGGIELTVTFFSPVDLSDLRRQSVPMSYITVTARCVDGGSHDVAVYLDITGEWAHGDRSRSIDWDVRVADSQRALSFAPVDPAVLAEDSEQASWGTVVFATDADSGLTYLIADADAARAAGAAGPLADTVEPGPRGIDDRWPVFAFSRDLGTVTAQTPSPEMVVTIGHVRTPAVSYLGAPLAPWWHTYWADWPDMLGWFRADYPAALAAASGIDARIIADAASIFGAGATADQYATIAALAMRQAVGGTELVDHDGAPWAFLKEISSDGNVSTVDVVYPAAPAFLYLAPNYLRLLLNPLLEYVRAGNWPQPFAPHDLGARYPVADGHNDGGGENMPVEESANLLIMCAALIGRPATADTTALLTEYYPQLRAWAEYLVPNALDPPLQNQTDDFAGPIAHSCNLALKGIIGIGAMSLIAQATGNADDRNRYDSIARDYIAQWAARAPDPTGSHLQLAYDDPGTWSIKYNGYADRLLGLNLVPPEVITQEATWYAGQANDFGVPLDNRHTYTKADWELWTAAFLINEPTARDLLVRSVYRFADTTGDRVPLTDWYDTVSGQRVGFAARPVVGGLFALLTLAQPGCAGT
ncbi:glutaminase family protein [Nocardia arthritidis]|uniref:DUF5127 domain-containing protein n=1 Tax=Nocardia arthritidis TaxID=228602 RepID=A0A6G9YA32_9NOCA|nr:glutaminase family protein [Nocardia arthritidis]QIS09980.1 DUF5127 domain-containing protein [Nocardia arthritidis]